MARYRFDEGCDGAWLAIDDVGNVAIFTTAGVAPLPADVDGFYAISPEEEVNRLPIVTEPEIFLRYVISTSYIGFASRGLFAYDWRDVHRTENKTNSYELIARPRHAISHLALPPGLCDLAGRVRSLVPFDRATSLAIGVFKSHPISK